MRHEKDEQVSAPAGPYVAGPTPDEARERHQIKATPTPEGKVPEPQQEAVSPDE